MNSLATKDMILIISIVILVLAIALATYSKTYNKILAISVIGISIVASLTMYKLSEINSWRYPYAGDLEISYSEAVKSTDSKYNFLKDTDAYKTVKAENDSEIIDYIFDMKPVVNDISYFQQLACNKQEYRERRYTPNVITYRLKRINITGSPIKSFYGDHTIWDVGGKKFVANIGYNSDFSVYTDKANFSVLVADTTAEYIDTPYIIESAE